MSKFLARMKQKENLPFIVFTICLVIIHWRIHLITGSDDDFMSTAIKTGDLTQLYANNRIVLNFLGSFIMSFPLVIWKMFNVAMLVFLVIMISKSTMIIGLNSFEKNRVVLNWGICFLFFLLPYEVLSTGAFWATGSFNYLWGICGSLFICMIFIKDMTGVQIKKAEMVAGLIWGVYACDVEQSMVIVCFGGITYLIYCFFCHKKINKSILFYGIGLILECIPIIFLPYSSYRSIGEQTVYYPDFGMLSFADKVYQGIMNSYNHWVNESALVLFLIALFTVILVYRNAENKILRFIAMLPVFYFLYALIAPLTIMKSSNLSAIGCNIYDFSEKLYYWGMGKGSFLPFFGATFTFILLSFLLYDILQAKYQKYTILSFYFSALATGIMMSFAPSIFVSGNRVFFASDILFWVIASILGEITIADMNIPRSAEMIFLSIAFCSMVLLSLIMGILFSRGVYW